jgi:two-component system NarL family sensor kinase
LSSALNWYAQRFGERSGIAVTLNVAENIGRLPSDMELAIFRSVQECLTNIQRHSGSKRADIRIFIQAESLHVEVSDQGKEISPERLAEIRSAASGVGIKGMQERTSARWWIEHQIERFRNICDCKHRVPKEIRTTDADRFQPAV